MEYLIGVIVLIALAVILGLDVTLISTLIMLAAALVMLCLVGFFAVCFVWLCKSTRRSGALSRVDKNPKFNYKSAYYIVDGSEYPNIFPCEIILKKYLYKPDKVCTIYLNKKHGFVFDGNAFACVITGLALGVVSLVMISAMTFFLAGGIL